jgi:cell volume regulation protein A
MHDLDVFGAAILVISLGLLAALLSAKISGRLSIPAPAVFLVAAALASDLFPSLYVSIKTVERVATVALIVILLDGGASIGWRRFRAAVGPIASLGVVGTFATAGAAALFGHWALGLDWTVAGLLGAAVAPTDPAVMFSVFGGHDVGRAGTVLEGESGANDPVGIALMIGLVDLATHPDATFWIVVREFCVQMAVGLAVGALGGLALRELMHRLSLPSSGLFTLLTLAGAGIVYGAAAVGHGSGFLAVFVTGLIVGDVHARFRTEIEIFQDTLSSLAEIVVFVALGLTIALSAISATRWGQGLLLAAVLALIIRPAVAGLLLLPTKLRHGERAFIAWGGLKGAVPILLASFALEQGVRDAHLIYELVFIVVLASVVVQGGTIGYAARRFGVRLDPPRAADAGFAPPA